MNKKIVTSLTSAALLALPFLAMAIQIPGEPGVTNISLGQLITAAFANFIWPLFFALIVVYILIIAFLFISAQGDPTKLQTARQALLWGIIGIVVFVLAYSLITIVKSTFGI